MKRFEIDIVFIVYFEKVLRVWNFFESEVYLNVLVRLEFIICLEYLKLNKIKVENF